MASPQADISYPSSSSPHSHDHSHDHPHPHSHHHNDDERPMILYKPPTALSLLRTTAINLILPFINGLMLGFGELFAHELAFRWGWGTTRVFPAGRLERRHVAGPGVEVREPEKRPIVGMEDLTSLE